RRCPYQEWCPGVGFPFHDLPTPNRQREGQRRRRQSTGPRSVATASSRRIGCLQTMRGKPMNTTAELKRLEPLESAVEQLYRNRFPEEVLGRRNAVWKVLCRCWFSRYIPRDARVLEIGAGYCEFINHTAAAERVAIDLNPETRLHAAPEVTVHEVAAEDLTT